MSSRTSLYVSQGLSSWGDRMWEFASFIFLVDVFPDSLLPAALLGFVVEGSAILFGPALGRKIDSWNRLRSICTALLTQNTSVAAASFLFLVVLTRMRDVAIDADVVSDDEKWYFFAGITFFAIFARLATVSSEVAVQRDWAVLLSAGDKDVLSRLNASLRRINLTSKVLSPIFVGVVTEAWSTRGAVLMVAVWNVLSLPVEYALIKRVYTAFPELAMPKGVAAVTTVVEADGNGNGDSGVGDTDELLKANDGKGAADTEKGEVAATPTVTATAAPTSTLESWLLYYQQPVFTASLAANFLYGSVVNFGGPMTSYLKTEHRLSDLVLALCRGGGALFGVSSTFVFAPGVRRSGGVVRFALQSFWLLVVCLIPAFVALLFFEDHTIGVYLLIGSIMCSRFALWSTDMAEAQVMQENVDPAVAGVIGTTERALMNGFMLFSYVLTMVFNKPHTFRYAVFAGVAFVFVGALVYTYFYNTFTPPHTAEEKTALVADDGSGTSAKLMRTSTDASAAADDDTADDVAAVEDVEVTEAIV
jgi:iron-regulated transporter 1